MGIPVLNLNLAPPPTLWRRQHHALGWGLLIVGALALLASAGFTWRAYLQADRLGRQAEGLSRQTLTARTRQADLLRELQAIDVAAEGPRWRLAERILSARSAPWSRITAELEACLVQDVRVRTLHRTRTSSGQVVLKLKGEGRSRAAQAAFVESLAASRYFEALQLEREAERPGGGVEFEGTLPLRPAPAPFQATPAPQAGLRPAPPSAPKPGPSDAPSPAATPAPQAPPPAAAGPQQPGFTTGTKPLLRRGAEEGPASAETSSRAPLRRDGEIRSDARRPAPERPRRPRSESEVRP